MALTGCATNNYLVPAEYNLDQSKSAYITGTIATKTTGEDQNPNTSSSILFRKVGSKESASISARRHFMGFTKWDFKERDRNGKVFKFALDPGEYEIYGVYFYYNNGQVSKTYETKEPFSIPFTVEEDNTYYIGEFLSYGLWGSNVFGISIPTGGYFEASENKKRDYDLLKVKFPELGNQEIIDLELTIQQPPFIFSKK